MISVIAHPATMPHVKQTIAISMLLVDGKGWIVCSVSDYWDMRGTGMNSTPATSPEPAPALDPDNARHIGEKESFTHLDFA